MPEGLRERVSLLGAYHLLMDDKQNGNHWEIENRPLSDTAGSGAPGGIRTRDMLLRRQPLYPLSYWDTLYRASVARLSEAGQPNRRRMYAKLRRAVGAWPGGLHPRCDNRY